LARERECSICSVLCQTPESSKSVPQSAATKDKDFLPVGRSHVGNTARAPCLTRTFTVTTSGLDTQQTRRRSCLDTFLCQRTDARLNNLSTPGTIQTSANIACSPPFLLPFLPFSLVPWLPSLAVVSLN